jgi:hypothetical protein
MHATYSPDDNKLRLYPDARLPRETYDRVKAAGFKWAPKQELFVAPAWTPDREDLLVELCGEIDDEDTSIVAHRAKAAVDTIADGIPIGQPILVGHHSERRARRDAEKIRDGMSKAVKLWRTASYWTERAAGSLGHAKYKELPAVRARRIKGIKADKRKQVKIKTAAEKWLKLWSKEGLTLEQARSIANYCHLYVCRGPEGQHWSAWDVLRPDDERYNGCGGPCRGRVPVNGGKPAGRDAGGERSEPLSDSAARRPAGRRVGRDRAGDGDSRTVRGNRKPHRGNPRGRTDCDGDRGGTGQHPR